MLQQTEEQKALAQAAHRFLSDNWDVGQVREALDGKDAGTGLDEAFAEMGWTSLTVDGDHGGGAADVSTACALVEQVGRHLAPSTVTVALLAGAVLSSLPDVPLRKEWLIRHCEGDLVAALVTDQHGAPATGMAQLSLLPDGGATLTIRGGWAVLTPRVTHLLVAAETDDQLRWCLVPVAADGLDLTALRRLDAQPLSVVSGEGLSLAAAEFVRTPSLPPVEMLGALLTAADLVGVTDVLLRTTCDYARTRKQFGHAIGSFQAVSHRLADILVDLELGRSLVMGAAHAYDTGDAEAPMLIAAAKAWMSDAAVRAGEASVQLHGGIGFTWESDVHLFLRRARAQAATFGTARHHRRLLAAGLGDWARDDK